MNTEQEHAELLPCPFCGDKPSISKHMGESLWSHDIVLWTQVQCDECEAYAGPTCEGFEVEAVDIWNSRVALQSQDLEGGDFLDSVEVRIKLLDENGNIVYEAIDHDRRVEGES